MRCRRFPPVTLRGGCHVTHATRYDPVSRYTCDAVQPAVTNEVLDLSSRTDGDILWYNVMIVVEQGSDFLFFKEMDCRLCDVS